MRDKNRFYLDTLIVSNKVKGLSKDQYDSIVKSDFDIRRILKVGLRHPDYTVTILAILAYCGVKTRNKDIDINKLEDRLYRIIRAHDMCFTEKDFGNYMVDILLDIHISNNIEHSISRVCYLDKMDDKLIINGKRYRVKRDDWGLQKGTYFTLNNKKDKAYSMIVISDGKLKIYGEDRIKDKKDRERLIHSLDKSSIDLVITFRNPDEDLDSILEGEIK